MNWLEIIGPVIGGLTVLVLNRLGIRIPGQPCTPKPGEEAAPAPPKSNTPILDGVRDLIDSLRKRNADDMTAKKELAALLSPPLPETTVFDSPPR